MRFWTKCSAICKPLRILRTVRVTLAAALSVAALAACASASSTARTGAVAPNWTEPTASGTQLTLDSLRGRPVYLNFFATWCDPCNEEAPYINDFQKIYAARGLQIVGVDELESRKKAQQFIAKYHLVYPAVVDDGKLQTQYSVNGLPVHVFINRSGVIAKIVVGQMDRAQIASAIRTIL